MSPLSVPSVWTEQFHVRHTDVTRKGFLRANVFFDYMQEAAANHAKSFGAGLVELNEKGLMWVLSRLKLKIARTPLLGENLTVTTWPSGVERLFATREFVLTDESGTTVAFGSSCWLLLDQRKLRPLKLPESLPVALPDNSSRPRHFSGLDKIPRMPVISPLSFPIHESMIDVNQHLNNAHYTAFVFDWLAKNTETIPQVEEIQVNFLMATAVDAELITAGTIDGKHFYVESLLGTEPHFQASGLLV